MVNELVAWLIIHKFNHSPVNYFLVLWEFRGLTAEPKTAKMENTNNENDGTVDKSDTKYKVPQVLGANKYKEALTKAEGFFKMKRYAEAKTAYEDVLKIKPGDVYATNKLAEVNKFLAK